MDPIVEFFNGATADELQTMQGCSKKKVEHIIKLRPFDDWDDLVGVLLCGMVYRILKPGKIGDFQNNFRRPWKGPWI